MNECRGGIISRGLIFGYPQAGKSGQLKLRGPEFEFLFMQNGCLNGRQRITFCT